MTGFKKVRRPAEIVSVGSHTEPVLAVRENAKQGVLRQADVRIVLNERDIGITIND